MASYTSANVPGRVPGVFTRVSYYVDWLEDVINAYERNIKRYEQDWLKKKNVFPYVNVNDDFFGHDNSYIYFSLFW